MGLLGGAKDRFNFTCKFRCKFTDTILATCIFDLQVNPMLPTKFRVSWPFGSGEEAKNRFSRWLPWQPSWISDQNDFSYF